MSEGILGMIVLEAMNRLDVSYHILVQEDDKLNVDVNLLFILHNG